MSNVLDISTGTRAIAGFRTIVTIATAIRRCCRAYSERRAHNRAVARLRSWSDSQLKDIGISRGQIEFAVKDTDGCRALHRRMD